MVDQTDVPAAAGVPPLSSDPGLESLEASVHIHRIAKRNLYSHQEDYSLNKTLIKGTTVV